MSLKYIHSGTTVEEKKYKPEDGCEKNARVEKNIIIQIRLLKFKKIFHFYDDIKIYETFVFLFGFSSIFIILFLPFLLLNWILFVFPFKYFLLSIFGRRIYLRLQATGHSNGGTVFFFISFAFLIILCESREPSRYCDLRLSISSI